MTEPRSEASRSTSDPVVAGANGDGDALPPELLNWLTPDLLPADRQLPREKMRPEYEAALPLLRRPFSAGADWESDIAKLPEDVRTHFPKDLQLRYARLIFGWVPAYRVSGYFAEYKSDDRKEALVRFSAMCSEVENSGGILLEPTRKRFREESGLDKAEAALDAAQRLPSLFRTLFEKEALVVRRKAETLADANLGSLLKQLDKASEELIADLTTVARKHLATYTKIAADAAFWEQFKPRLLADIPKFNWPDPRLTIAGLLRWASTMLTFRFPAS